MNNNWKLELHKLSLWNKVTRSDIGELSDFIEQELKKEREEIVEMIENRIEETKIKKRETPFQDTLFNYEVNVLEEIINTIKNRT